MSEIDKKLNVFKILKNFINVIGRSGLVAIFINELRVIISSRRFKIFLFIMFFPSITSLFTGPSSTVFTDKTFEASVGLNVLNFWAGLPGQIMVIIIASELIAREFEKGTIKLIFNSPTRKSSIVLGKYLALFFLTLIVSFSSVFLFACVLDLKNGKGGEMFYKHLVDLSIASLITTMGLLTISSIAIVVSTFSKKSLYAGVISIFVLLTTLILPYLIPVLTNPEVYTINHQLGVLLEEFIWLGRENLYIGNPFISFNALYMINALTLLFTIVTISRVEVI